MTIGQLAGLFVQQGFGAAWTTPRRWLSVALMVLMTVVSVGMAWSPAQAESVQYRNATSGQTLDIHQAALQTDGKALFVGTNLPLNKGVPFSVTRLPNPHRLVIDFPNTQLTATPPLSVLPINKFGVRDVFFKEQKASTFSNVRITVVCEDSETLARLSTRIVDKGLFVDMNPDKTVVAKKPKRGKNPSDAAVTTLEEQKAAVVAAAGGLEVPPAPPKIQPSTNYPIDTRPIDAIGSNVIEEVYFQQGQLVLVGKDGGALTIKDQFTLDAPNRLVLDIGDSALSSRRLLAPLEIHNGTIEQIRLGQFDNRTVRVVIDTNRPEKFLTGYEGDKRHVLKVYPTQSSATSVAVAGGSQQNEVTGVSLSDSTGDGYYRRLVLTTSGPVAHRLVRDKNVLLVEMPDVDANPGWVGFSRDKHPEFESIRLERRPENNPGSLLVVRLKKEYGDSDVRTLVQNSGNTLEVLVNPRSSAVVNVAALSSGRKAPFPARVVVDAGHGGKDNGAMRSGTSEKDLNLAVALKLRKALEARGMKVYMTRDTDKFLPLSQITSITNRIRPDLFVSVHHNASVKNTLNGIETYYYTPQSLALARKVHHRMVTQVKAPDRKVRKAMFYVIHHTRVPAVLCEVGYVSNPYELKQLRTEARQNAAANAIADGVVDYLQSRATAASPPPKEAVWH